jgi:DNA invertase Pin-like site-specific DNA recombinase
VIIGYIRVSSEQQSFLNQKHRILEYAQENKIVIDQFIELEISSRKTQKERLLDAAFEKLTNGDSFICTELSRLGRNMLEILNLIEKFNQNNINIVFTNQQELSTDNKALSSLLLAIYGYFAQTEREIISERTKQGLKAAREQGKILGRPKGSKNKNRVLDSYVDEIENYLKLSLSQTSILKLINAKLEKSISLTSLRYFIATTDKLKNIK